MKKVILLFVAAITFSGTFVSCSSDDDGASLIGKWAFYKTGGAVSGAEILSNYENYCSTKKDYMEFKSDGTAITHYFNTECSEETYTSTYTRSGNTITLGTESPETATIMQLSGSTLKVKYTDEDFPDGYGITVFQKIN